MQASEAADGPGRWTEIVSGPLSEADAFFNIQQKVVRSLQAEYDAINDSPTRLAEDSSQRTGADATHEKQIPQVDKAVHFEEHSGADTNYEEQSQQMPPSKERKISSHVLDAISAVTACDYLASQANEEANPRRAVRV